MGKSIRHLRFRGRFEQRMGIFPKNYWRTPEHSNLHYRACATEYDSARQAVQEAIEAPSRDLSAIASAKRESAIATCEFKDIVPEYRVIAGRLEMVHSGFARDIDRGPSVSAATGECLGLQS
jgi:hypothetical protein